MREVLSARRRSETFDMRFWNQRFSVTVGYYGDGRPGEIFIDGGKAGQDVQATARDAAIAISLAIQHGAAIDTMRRAFTRDGREQPTSILGAVLDQISQSRLQASPVDADGSATAVVSPDGSTQ